MEKQKETKKELKKSHSRGFSKGDPRHQMKLSEWKPNKKAVKRAKKFASLERAHAKIRKFYEDLESN